MEYPVLKNPCENKSVWRLCVPSDWEIIWLMQSIRAIFYLLLYVYYRVYYLKIIDFFIII